MQWHKRLFLFFVIGFLSLYAQSIESKYPSYSYVFHEFDVDESYLDDIYFQQFVTQNEKKLSKFYKRSLKRGETLLPMLQGHLIQEGVSDLFVYLSMIESGFSTTIVSPKKAVGLWQFMPATAKQYDLKVCSSYDERCDAVSATSAAIRYLNKLYRQFGKWYLAAMAYNCGEGCLKRAIRKAGSDDIGILTDEHAKYLPKETRDYIRKILLIAMIGENSNIDFDHAKERDNELVKVEIDNSSSLQEIAKLIKMDTKRLLALNPQYKNGTLPKHKAIHTINIPLEKIYAFYLRYDAPTIKKPNLTYKSHMITHRVKLGETLESIAKLYDANVDEIRMANHMKYPFVTLGSLLVIPVTETLFHRVAQ